jgi:hypothetical protein
MTMMRSYPADLMESLGTLTQTIHQTKHHPLNTLRLDANQQLLEKTSIYQWSAIIAVAFLRISTKSSKTYVQGKAQFQT